MSDHRLPTLSFASEVFLAAGLALLAGLLLNSSMAFSTFTYLGVSAAWASVLTGLYLSALALRSNAKAGRITMLLAWALVAAALHLLGASLLLQCAWHVLAISGTRTFLYYPSPLRLLADLMLSALACAVALWTLFHSHSPLLTVWSFFLVQAAWSWIYTRAQAPKDAQQQQQRSFDAAQASATAAIRRMTRSQRRASTRTEHVSG